VTLHIVHLHDLPFNTLIPSAASSLNIPIITYMTGKWLSKLSEEH
jgi:hypothetical protein